MCAAISPFVNFFFKSCLLQRRQKRQKRLCVEKCSIKSNSEMPTLKCQNHNYTSDMYVHIKLYTWGMNQNYYKDSHV